MYFKVADKKENNSKPVFFITGTNTDVGKTFVTCALLEAMSTAGLTTAAMKPIACGGIEQDGVFISDDALALSTAMTAPLAMDVINPFLFQAPVSPNIAAERQGAHLTVALLLEKTRGFLSQPEDALLIEGAGGWEVPLNQQEVLADYVVALGIPVILVVGMTLGCLNHTLLTVRDLQSRHVPLAGWVANQVDPSMQAMHDNVQTLQARIAAPLLATIPYQSSPNYKQCSCYFSQQLPLLITS